MSETVASPLTWDDVLDMEGGPQMDQAVAERLMGWERREHTGLWTHNPTRQWSVQPYLIPRYSTTIKQAWEVLGRFEGAHLEVTQWSSGGWQVTIGANSLADGTLLRAAVTLTQNEWADTAPLAICRAALLTTL